MPFEKELNTPLLKLPLDETCNRILETCAGLHVWGGVGSGKTSGSSKNLVRAYLRAGFGGVVTSVKEQPQPDIDLDH
jgi:hypothetical protein